jgi:hypothetical protein
MQNDAQEDIDSLLRRAARFHEFGELAAAKDVLARSMKNLTIQRKLANVIELHPHWIVNGKNLLLGWES